jgi:hypothetical protein
VKVEVEEEKEEEDPKPKEMMSTISVVSRLMEDSVKRKGTKGGASDERLENEEVNADEKEEEEIKNSVALLFEGTKDVIGRLK